MNAPAVNLPTGTADTDGMPVPRRYWVLSCILLGVTLMSLDSAIANIALPTIARDLQASESATVWVATAYQVGAVVCLLPAATLAEIFTLKRIYTIGLIVFAIGSLGCALAPSLGTLIGMRVLQGAGGACLAALGPALIRSIYPRRLIGSGLAMIALCVATSGAAGPTVASLILSIADWPWLFLVNLPLCLIAIPVFLRFAEPGKPVKRPFDFVGAVLSATALGLLVMGVETLGSGHLERAAGEIAGGVVALALLIWQQMRRPAPMLPLDLLRLPLFSLSVVTSICSYSAQILAYVSLPFLFQTVMHRSQLATGLLVTPWPLMVIVAAPIAGRLTQRYPAAILGSIGLAILATGLVALALLPAEPRDWDIIWRMGICGIGFGFFQTPNNTAIMTAGPTHRSGAAGGMLAVARTFGWCLGSAIVALIFAVSTARPTATCLQTAAVFAAAAALASVARFRSKPLG